MTPWPANLLHIRERNVLKERIEGREGEAKVTAAIFDNCEERGSFTATANKTDAPAEQSTFEWRAP